MQPHKPDSMFFPFGLATATISKPTHPSFRSNRSHPFPFLSSNCFATTESLAVLTHLTPEVSGRVNPPPQSVNPMALTSKSVFMIFFASLFSLMLPNPRCPLYSLLPVLHFNFLSKENVTLSGWANPYYPKPKTCAAAMSILMRCSEVDLTDGLPTLFHTQRQGLQSLFPSGYLKLGDCVQLGKTQRSFLYHYFIYSLRCVGRGGGASQLDYSRSSQPPSLPTPCLACGGGGALSWLGAPCLSAMHDHRMFQDEFSCCSYSGVATNPHPSPFPTPRSRPS